MADNVDVSSQNHPETQDQPETQSSTQAGSSEKALGSHVSHNIQAFLDHSVLKGSLKKDFEEMLIFLKRSRISKAISEEVYVHKSHIADFWNSAKVVKAKGEILLDATVAGVRLFPIRESAVRRALGFDDNSSDRTVLDKEKVRACLIRCGYPEATGPVYKKFFGPPFKYLAHIMIHCISRQKSGFDQMNEVLQDAMAALLLNIPFNFSRMVFQGMVENVTDKKNKFLLYPRFVQMIINVYDSSAEDHEKLPRPLDGMELSKMTVDVLRNVQSYHGIKYIKMKLFGHVINPNYECPPGKDYKHAESDCEDLVEYVEIAEEEVGKKRKAKGKSMEDVGFEKRSRRGPSLLILHKGKKTAAEGPSASSRSTSVPPETTPENTAIIHSSSDMDKKMDEFMKAVEKRVMAAETEAREAKSLAEKLMIENKQMKDKLARMEMDSMGYFIDKDYAASKQLEDEGDDDAEASDGTRS